MPLSKQSAIDLRDNILPQCTTHIRASMVPLIYNYYNTEINPGRYREIPCTCSKQEWIRILSECRIAVDEALATPLPTPEVVEASIVFEESKPVTKNKKKDAKNTSSNQS